MRCQGSKFLQHQELIKVEKKNEFHRLTINADRGIPDEIKVETITTGEETILEIKSTIRWPFQSSLILLVFQWRQRTDQKTCCTFRASVLRIYFFSFPSSFWVYAELVNRAVTIETQNSPWYATISLEHRRIDEKRATKSTSTATHKEGQLQICLYLHAQHFDQLVNSP